MNLRFYIQDLNFVVYMSRHADQLILDFHSFGVHAWNKDKNMKWEFQCIPTNMTELLYPCNAEDVLNQLKQMKI